MKDFKNSTKTQNGFAFPAEHGFTGSTGMVKVVKPYTRKIPTVKLATGGSVGNATTQRDQPSNELDEISGGKTPLRPGFAKGGKNWIAGATKNKGALHRALKVPEGEKIPTAKLEKAENSKSPLMRKRAALAETLGSMHKAKGGALEHADVAADKKLIKSMVKPGVLKKAEGGKVKRTEEFFNQLHGIKKPVLKPQIPKDSKEDLSPGELSDSDLAKTSKPRNYAVGGYAKGGKSYGRFDGTPVIGKKC